MSDSRILQLVPGLPDAPARPALEAVVRDVYATAYGAHVTHMLPVLLGLRERDTGGPPTDGTAPVTGVIGAQPGEVGRPMLLEEYLDVPVEVALSRAVGAPVPRAALAEVGNLAAARPGLGRALVGTMAAYLDGAGVHWAVFTATRALRLAFVRMGLELLDLGAADGRRLGGRLADWGTYYDTEPRVTAVPVPAMCAATARDQCLAAACAASWSDARRHGALRARNAA